MPIAIKYTIFKTEWGHFGLLGTESGLLQTHLPAPEPAMVKSEVLRIYPTAQHETDLFEPLQRQITAYFDQSCMNFDKDIPVILDGLSVFAQQVLTACRRIKFGQTISYFHLAKKIGRPAARAVGGALAQNPLPLLIPCHRVIQSDGQPGGFSPPGGTDLKSKLLQHEQKILMDCKSSR